MKRFLDLADRHCLYEAVGVLLELVARPVDGDDDLVSAEDFAAYRDDLNHGVRSLMRALDVTTPEFEPPFPRPVT